VVVGIGIGGYFIANGQKFPIVNGTRAALMGGAEADGSGAAVFSAEEAAGAADALLAAEAIADEEEELDDEDDDVRVKSLIPKTSAKFSKARQYIKFINHVDVHLIVHFVVHINSNFLPDFPKGWQQSCVECKFRKKAPRAEPAEFYLGYQYWKWRCVLDS
jgi:hypothetical protein